MERKYLNNMAQNCFNLDLAFFHIFSLKYVCALVRSVFKYTKHENSNTYNELNLMNRSQI